MNSVVTQLVFAFALRQLESFGQNTDWAKVKQDFEPRVRKAVPGSLLDNQAVKVANKIIDTIAGALVDGAVIAGIVVQLQAGDYDGAAKTLKREIANASNDELVKALLAA